jgi:tagatose-1,6-bisphosphate aldolase non-catalytic subunit AgaZ/GatZ
MLEYLGSNKNKQWLIEVHGIQNRKSKRRINGFKKECKRLSPNEHKFDKSYIRKVSMENGVPIADLILKTANKISKKVKMNMTLLGVCPNSHSVLKSALRSAQKFCAPLMFTATLNQVDLDGGYTTWTQEDFVNIVKEESAKIGFEGPTIVALDHGGPWLKDRHVLENLGLDETVYEVKKSLVACLEAGYDLLHIDATVDKSLPKGENIRIETVVQRTADFMEYVEDERKKRNLPKISYEVGTEEVHGGLADVGTFEKFLLLLKSELTKRNLVDVWPCFVVGKIGTDLHTTEFDPEMAKQLTHITGKYGSYVKGHYTDFVTNLQEYPKAGIGGANVGPEFSQAEFDSLERLDKTEEKLVAHSKVTEPSLFRSVLKDCIIESGRWKKWLLQNEKGKTFNDLSLDRQRWLLQTGSRYVWAQKSVVKARMLLYQNMKKNSIDGEETVLGNIDAVMEKYITSFNLVNVTSRIGQALKAGLLTAHPL